MHAGRYKRTGRNEHAGNYSMRGDMSMRGELNMRGDMSMRGDTYMRGKFAFVGFWRSETPPSQDVKVRHEGRPLWGSEGLERSQCRQNKGRGPGARSCATPCWTLAAHSHEWCMVVNPSFGGQPWRCLVVNPSYGGQPWRCMVVYPFRYDRESAPTGK